MRRLIKVTLFAAAIALACGIWVFTHRGPTADVLAEAEAALRADEPKRALRLADEHLARAPADARWHVIRGLAHLRLQDCAKAREDLQRAVQLEPSNACATIALAETHVVPAADVLKRCRSMGELDELEAALSELYAADDILRSANLSKPACLAAVRQAAAANAVQMACLARRAAELLGDELKTAEAGHATERLGEIRRQLQAAEKRAERMEKQAAAKLCRAVRDARLLIAGQLGEQERRFLADQADKCARRSIGAVLDRASEDCRKQVRQILGDLETLSPVAAAEAAVREASEGHYHGSKERREALAAACSRLDRLLDRAAGSEDRNQILLCRASLALAMG